MTLSLPSSSIFHSQATLWVKFSEVASIKINIHINIDKGQNTIRPLDCFARKVSKVFQKNKPISLKYDFDKFGMFSATYDHIISLHATLIHKYLKYTVGVPNVFSAFRPCACRLVHNISSALNRIFSIFLVFYIVPRPAVHKTHLGSRYRSWKL
jgi:hypothetical protein